MATATVDLSELELLHRFIGEQLAGGDRKKPIEACLAEFREYRQELERLREEIRPALEQSLAGESMPLDISEVKKRGRERLRQRGITD